MTTIATAATALATKPLVTYKLTAPAPIDSLSQPIQEELTKFYTSSSNNCRLVATILNAMFAEQRYVFTLSRNVIRDLIANDPNYTNGQFTAPNLSPENALKVVTDIVSKTKLLTVVVPQKARKAGVWAVALPVLRECNLAEAIPTRRKQLKACKGS